VPLFASGALVDPALFFYGLSVSSREQILILFFNGSARRVALASDLIPAWISSHSNTAGLRTKGR
jgi:hypothetical protein